MPQTRRMAAQTVCHFSHNADFCRLRISKYPANAHEITYFSTLNTECGTVFDMINFCFWRMVWKIFLGFGRMVCRYEIWIGEMWDEVCARCGSAYWEKGA